jgi:KDO2-lipid IV(A) lauroyltransferase
MSKTDHLRDYPAYILLKLFCGIVQRIPRKFVFAFFSLLSRIVYIVDRRHRVRALRNLDIAFGDSKLRSEKRRIAKQAFESLFLTVAETIYIPVLVKDIDRYAKFQRDDRIADVLKEGKGLIFLVSHFGNWEIMAHACVSMGYQLASVARPIKNKLVNDELERIRCCNGAEILRKKWVVKEIISKLRNNYCVAILIDQYAGRHAPFVPFFGRPVSTTPAAALLALKTGAAVVPVFDVRQEGGFHNVYVDEPVEIINTGNREKDIAENCARFNQVLEKWVRRYPEKWLWMHRRWRRKKAPGEP